MITDMYTVPVEFEDGEVWVEATGSMHCGRFMLTKLETRNVGGQSNFISDINTFCQSWHFEYLYLTPEPSTGPKVVKILAYEKNTPNRDTIGRLIHEEKKDLSISFENLEPHMVDEVLRYVGDLSKNAGVITGVDIRTSEDS